MRVDRILALCVGLAIAAPAAAAKPQVGRPAPEATLNLVSGETIKISDLRGQVVVLNFWATWCGPCKTELPMLDRFYRLRKQYGLRIFAVTTEDSLPLSQLKKLFAVLAIDNVRKVRGPYTPFEGVPTNIVIDREGIVRYAAAGAFNLDGLNAVLIPLLKEPAPKPAAQTAVN